MAKHDNRRTDRDAGDQQTRAHLRLPASQVYEIVRIEGESELRRHGTGRGAPCRRWYVRHGERIQGPFPIQLFSRYLILGRMQLFTENTVTVILPLLKQPGIGKLWSVARLWTVVFVANLVGTLAIALANTFIGTTQPEYVAAMLEVAAHYAHTEPVDALLRGVPAGFFIAAIVWMLPSSEGSEFWVIVTLTFLIAFGGFTHVVAGSSEVFLLLVSGEIGPAQALLGVIAPSLAGNILGGTGLFALLAYGQVHEEV